MQVSLIKYAAHRNRFDLHLTKRHEKIAIGWLEKTGWIHDPNRRLWCRPDARYRPTRYFDWSLREALYLNAEAVGAKLLRERGWKAPHRHGLGVFGKLCRRPEGGRWLSLRGALKLAGIDVVESDICGSVDDEVIEHLLNLGTEDVGIYRAGESPLWVNLDWVGGHYVWAHVEYATRYPIELVNDQDERSGDRQLVELFIPTGMSIEQARKVLEHYSLGGK